MHPRRRSSSRRPHPWLFMLAVGTGVAALVHGDGGVAIAAGIAMYGTRP